jgi:molecular chaperone DnaK (HSP70)
MSRYAIGIDLGTTHSALAEVDPDLSEGEEIALSSLEVPQSIAPGEVAGRKLLPSFAYLAEGAGLGAGALDLPWRKGESVGVGEIARALGGKSPGRLVASAKSWLAAEGHDPRAAILPEGGGDGPRLSPLEASTRYLTHLRRAWEAHHDTSIAEHDVVITVPASFDPGARELTSEAAEAAGLGHAVLLEEPQAALYSWIQKRGSAWRRDVAPGDVILVIDVGGGTTDFSLILVTDEGGALGLTRLAVGDHILCGGDNMDLLLAHRAKERIEASGAVLDAGQWSGLVRACCDAKEKLLSENAPETVPVATLGKGSKLVGGTLKTELSKKDVEELLCEGFFPEVAIDAAPAKRTRAGLTQIGLPYAHDAAITRHLAAFLSRQKLAIEGVAALADRAGTFVHPSRLLFNGGVLKSPVLRERLLRTLNGWLKADGGHEVVVLSGEDLDLAVARGAAYYAYVRRGKGVRIRGGTAKSFYVGVEGAAPAVPGVAPKVSAICIAPFGMEEGTSAPPAPIELGLVVGEPVEFRFFGSSLRRDDVPGTVVERWEGQMEELSPIRASLPAEGHKEGEVVPVRLEAHVSETGVLSLHAVSRKGERWKVELFTR